MSPDQPGVRAPLLIGLDWGTSSCRAYLLGGGGAVLDGRSAPLGTMAIAAGERPRVEAYEAAFERLCGSWLDAHPSLPVVAAGMVGSNHGWVEAPYRSVPVDLLDPATSGAVATSARGVAVHIISGLVDRGGLPGVMRGEETQVLGALPVEAPGTAVRHYVLPGTHSKWVRLAGPVVTGFATFLTGELHRLLLEHSVLATSAEPSPEPCWPAFAQGVTVAAAEHGRAGLLGTVFSARSLPLTGAMPKTHVPDYLSGLLIGAELLGGAMTLEGGTTTLEGGTGDLVLIGEPALADRYCRAAMQLGWPPMQVLPDAAPMGLWRSAVAMGLLATPQPTASGGAA